MAHVERASPTPELGLEARESSADPSWCQLRARQAICRASGLTRAHDTNYESGIARYFGFPHRESIPNQLPSRHGAADVRQKCKSSVGPHDATPISIQHGFSESSSGKTRGAALSDLYGVSAVFQGLLLSRLPRSAWVRRRQALSRLDLPPIEQSYSNVETKRAMSVWAAAERGPWESPLTPM